MWTSNQPECQMDIKHKGPEKCQERCWHLEGGHLEAPTTHTVCSCLLPLMWCDVLSLGSQLLNIAPDL
jgi:hypothetical protein